MDRSSLMVRAAVAIGLIMLLALGGYRALMRPKLTEIETLRVRLARDRETFRSLPPAPQVPPITEAERQLWGELEKRLRERYPAEPDLPKAAVLVANLARSTGMELISLDVQALPVAGTQPQKSALPPVQLPPELAVNPSTIKLVAYHQYRDLVEFLEGLRRASIYFAVQSLEVKRMENRLSTETSIVSFGWAR